MPEHDLEPPKFSRRALEHLLRDWRAVHSMIMTGMKEKDQDTSNYIGAQSGTTLLDKFTHSLLVKCYPEALDKLIETLVREMKSQDTEHATFATEVARRFMRSVVRIYVIFNIELAPVCKKRTTINLRNQPITICKQVFRSMVKLAIQELCEIADSLIAPVRLGVARPTAPFSLATTINEIISGSEELFLVDPLAAPAANIAPNGASQLPLSTPYPLLSEAVRNHGRTLVVNRAIPDAIDAENMAIDNDDDNASELADTSDYRAHSLSVGMNEGESQEAPAEQQEAGGGQGDDSDTELDLLVETESDSDDNHSNQDAASAQRSVQTGATVGSDTGELVLIVFSCCLELCFLFGFGVWEEVVKIP